MDASINLYQPPSNVPIYTTLHEFVADLRAWVFEHQIDAARTFGVNHATIVRYENGHTRPPLGYVASLAQMVAVRLGHQLESMPVRQGLLAEVNRAIRARYANEALLRDWVELEHKASEYRLSHSPRQPGAYRVLRSKHDWELAPAPPLFFGREAVLTTLTRWIGQEHCQIVSILGIGGVGKTWLASRLADAVAPHFTHVIWRSLRNAPPPAEIVPDLIRFVADQRIGELPPNPDRQLAMLISLLQKTRALLVLDNLEAVLLPGEKAGRMRPGYEGYGDLLRVLAESDHQSCLLLTSREQPLVLAQPQGLHAAVRTWRLDGLDSAAVMAWLAPVPLQGDAADWEQLVAQFSGNPLALQFAASAIAEQYGGQIPPFLRDRLIPFGEVRDLLDQQFERLSPLEQAPLYWLAILRQPASHDQIVQLMTPALSKGQLVHGMQALLRRCWVEAEQGRFGLQNVILEYLTDRLVNELSEAVLAHHLERLQRHALLLAYSPEYIQTVQRRLLLQPIAQRLVDALGEQGAMDCLQALKRALQQALAPPTGYAGANLLHLLAHLNHGDLHGQDFAQLTIQRAVLNRVELRAASFAGANLVECEWSEAFGLVDAVAFSPDGRWLAVGASNDTLALWQVTGGDAATDGEGDATLQEPRRFEPLLNRTDDSSRVNRAQRIRVLVFHPKGKLLAAGYENGAIGVWETQQGRLLTVLTGHTRQLYALSFTPTGDRLLSASVDQTVCLWAVAGWGCVEHWQAELQRAKALAFSPVTPLLATSVQNQVSIWDWQAHQLQQRFQDPEADEILSLAFRPDGNALASGDYHGALCLWDVASGRRHWRSVAHRHEVRCLTFSADGRQLASVSQDGAIRLWDAQNGAALQVIETQENALCTASFHPNHQLLASGAQDGVVRLWRVARPGRMSPAAGRCLTTRQGWSPRLWELAFATGASPSDPAYLAGGGDDGRIQVWDWPTGSLQRVLVGHTRAVRALACPPATAQRSALLASGSNDLTVRLWQVASGRCQRVLQGHTGGVLALAFHPRAALLASGGYDNRVHIWDVESGECLSILTECRDTVRALAFSPDGTRLAASSSDRALHLWDATTFAYQAALRGHAEPVGALAFDPTGHTLASADSTQVRLWALGSGQCLQTFTGCYPLRFHPTRQILIFMRQDRSTLQAVDGQVGDMLHTYRGAIGHLHCLQFSPDGHQLLGVGEEGVVRVWDQASGAPLQTIAPACIYAGMNIRGVVGLHPLQKATLHHLGALEEEPA